MDVIAEFSERYRREVDYYDHASRLCAQLLEAALQSAGIRAIVTFRAKNPARLETKLRQRHARKRYTCLKDISEDIVDLAGVRLALYFPGEISEVDKIVRKNFQLICDPKEFPNGSVPPYKKRFSGYSAKHYRVRLTDTQLSDPQKRYADATIEIQVASVLMHAWSEVEHDLVYKPLQGQLSDDEYAILDELNGLVLAGEIALERLQRAAEARASLEGNRYADHYDLAASLLKLSRVRLSKDIDDAGLGRVDQLFELMRRLQLNTPEQLAKFVGALHSDIERRPIAEQIVDAILSQDPDRYEVFEQIRADETKTQQAKPDSLAADRAQAIGQFLGNWIELENVLRLRQKPGTFNPSALRAIRSIPDLPVRALRLADRLQSFRNMLVHGMEVPETEVIRDNALELRTLLKLVKRRIKEG